MNNIIDAKSISFTYPNAQKKVIADCSFSVAAGEMVSLLGPNGAGKSTLLNCLCGLLEPQSGQVLVGGKDIRTLSQREISGVIGYVQQFQASTFSYTVFDYVLMGRASKIGLFQKPSRADREMVERVLTEMGILYLADSSIMEISGGERQQAAIARAIVQQPKVIFFDEPTAHLDYGNQVKTLKIIHDLKQKGFAVVMTTHTPDHCIMLGGTVVILNRDGTVLKGACDQLLTEETLRSTYATDLKLIYVKEAGRNVCIPEKITDNP